MTQTSPVFALPDPDTRPEFYDGVLIKRFFAWLIDFVLIAIPTVILFVVTIIPLVLTFFGVFLIPVMMAGIAFLYRWSTLASGSATLGMRMMALELREADGSRLRGSTALYHTIGFQLSMAIPLIQLASVVMMITGARKQGLSDLVLDTAMINRPGRAW